MDRGPRALTIVDAHRSRSLSRYIGPRHEPSSAEQLRLQVRQEAFGHGVVVGIADRAHRRPHSGFATSFAEGHGRVLEALDAVAGTAGNSVYALATSSIQRQVSEGVSLNRAMAETAVFPAMLLQMCSIGEESGALDHMLAKAAGFFEDEVDQQLASLTSLLEPFIIVTLGVLIGGIVVAMYLPIFQLGQVS